MKPKTIVLIFIYFAIFSVGGYFLYTKYLKNIFFPKETKNTQENTQAANLYYSSGNNLYQLNPGVLTQNPSEAQKIRLQSTGQVEDLVVLKTKDIFFYDTYTPQNEWEIWQVSLVDNTSEKLFSAQIPGLENFKNFLDPQISKDETKLAFLARHNETDNIFLYNLKDKGITNLSNQVFKGKIESLTWSLENDKIFFSSNLENKGGLYQIDLKKNLTKIWEGEGSISEIASTGKTLIFAYTLKSQENTNLNLLTLSDRKNSTITDLAPPKKVVNFQLSMEGDYVVFEAQDENAKTQDLYLIKSDGTNLLQLTEDGKSSKPVFSPEGNKIAFWIKKTGIYVMNINKSQKQKILNTAEVIDNILAWR